MPTRFRLVFFVPDPFSGARWPLGALVEGDGQIRAAKAQRAPCARCVGGARAASLWRRLRDRLPEVTDFGRLPMALGPYVQLGAIASLSDNGWDAVQWLENYVLPTSGEREPSLRQLHREVTAFRGRVLAVGGVEPTVTLQVDVPPCTARLHVDGAQAKQLGALLFEEVDVEADVYSDGARGIVGGRVLSVEPVPEGSGLEAWQAWGREALSHVRFDTIEDVERWLGRDEE